MAIAYPPQLPYPSREDYGLQHVDPMVRTQMQSGRARQRRRFTSVPTMARVSWTLTTGQAQLFEGWYKHIINDGASWFECPLQTPMGIKHYEARFTGIYDGPDLVGVDHWRVSAQVEIRKRQTVSELDVQFPDELVYSDLFDRTMNRNWPEN